MEKKVFIIRRCSDDKYFQIIDPYNFRYDWTEELNKAEHFVINDKSNLDWALDDYIVPDRVTIMTRIIEEDKLEQIIIESERKFKKLLDSRRGRY